MHRVSKDPSISEMFNKMIGTQEPDPAIVIPKYNKLLALSNKIIKVFNMMGNKVPFIIFDQEFPNQFSELRSFVERADKILNSFVLEKNDDIYVAADLSELNKNPEKLMEYLKSREYEYKITGLGDKYKKLKECAIIQEIIVTGKNIHNSLMLEKERINSDTHCLKDKLNLSDDFIMNADGDFLQLFGFTSLDLKLISCSPNMNDQIKKYMLTMLYHIYNNSREIIKIIMSPDINVDEFVDMMIKSIDDFKKHIPRCDDAFNLLKNNVDLFKNNFQGYYKDFVLSKNPSLIMENYIKDVASKSSVSPKIILQFRQIQQKYQKDMQSRGASNPEINKIFDMLGVSLNSLEEGCNNKDEFIDYSKDYSV